VEKMTKNPPHVVAGILMRTSLEGLQIPGWFLNVQDPVTLADSEPEPDVTVIRGTCRQFLQYHPTAKDVGMLVEVSESSLEEDRTVQLQLYAEAKIPVYWIVNLIDQQIEVYTDPSGPAVQPTYGRQQIFRIGDLIPVIMDGKEVGRLPVRDLLP
jgi:Uma2 family endonuclease